MLTAHCSFRLLAARGRCRRNKRLYEQAAATAPIVLPVDLLVAVMSTETSSERSCYAACEKIVVIDGCWNGKCCSHCERPLLMSMQFGILHQNAVVPQLPSNALLFECLILLPHSACMRAAAVMCILDDGAAAQLAWRTVSPQNTAKAPSCAIACTICCW